MDRRDFLAANTAALASAVLSQTTSQAHQPIPRAKWIENGIIDAGGSHEPHSFVIRRGGYRMDAHERYQEAQSEEVLHRLKSQGVEVFHTHFYKGAGMAHEKAEMEDAKRVAAIAHRLGMRVDSYLQWNTMMYETFFAEEPRAKNWLQRDEAGIPIKLVYGFQQSYRYRPCFANAEYLEYLGRIVQYAVEEVKTDFIHFDNFDLNPEPDSCHCESCVNGLRRFLRTKYTAAERKERFGFENIDHVNPPSWNRQNPPERMEIIFDPAIQEWIDFRCQVMSDALGQMARLAKSINPEVVIEVNPHGIQGGNRAWEAGLDHSRFLKHTQVFWTEEHNAPEYLDDGRLISTIRSYKLGRRYNNIVFTYIAGDPAAMAESLAFNQTIGYAGNDPLSKNMLQYIAFYKQHRDYFTGAVDAGNVALLRSYPSITYHNARAQLSAILMEQALIQSRIPFDLIFDEHVADLSKYRVLILPDSQCLSDAQLASIRSFVQNGGGLVATGLSGMYDHWRRLRVKPGLVGLVDSQRPARGYEENVQRSEEAGRHVTKEFDKGRVVYFPSIPFNGDLPPMTSYFKIDRRFWKAPANWAEMAKLVRWAAREEIPVTISGPPYLVANLVAQPENRRSMIHLINYNHRNTPEISPVEITCSIPKGQAVKQVRILSPDDAPRTIEARPAPGGAAFTVPLVKTYSIAVVNW